MFGVDNVIQHVSDDLYIIAFFRVDGVVMEQNHLPGFLARFIFEPIVVPIVGNFPLE